MISLGLRFEGGLHPPPPTSSVAIVDFSFIAHNIMQLIMSSDKLGSIQQPVVSVDLDLCEGGETRRENVELSKDELEQLITSLEAANKVHVHMYIVHS